MGPNTTATGTTSASSRTYSRMATVNRHSFVSIARRHTRSTTSLRMSSGTWASTEGSDAAVPYCGRRSFASSVRIRNGTMSVFVVSSPSAPDMTPAAKASDVMVAMSAPFLVRWRNVGRSLWSHASRPNDTTTPQKVNAHALTMSTFVDMHCFRYSSTSSVGGAGERSVTTRPRLPHAATRTYSDLSRTSESISFVRPVRTAGRRSAMGCVTSYRNDAHALRTLTIGSIASLRKIGNSVSQEARVPTAVIALPQASTNAIFSVMLTASSELNSLLISGRTYSTVTSPPNTSACNITMLSPTTLSVSSVDFIHDRNSTSTYHKGSGATHRRMMWASSIARVRTSKFSSLRRQCNSGSTSPESTRASSSSSELYFMCLVSGPSADANPRRTSTTSSLASVWAMGRMREMTQRTSTELAMSASSLARVARWTGYSEALWYLSSLSSGGRLSSMSGADIVVKAGVSI
eukprot:PhM_4_TR13625/c0_g1_i1/m.63862